MNLFKKLFSKKTKKEKKTKESWYNNANEGGAATPGKYYPDTHNVHDAGLAEFIARR